MPSELRTRFIAAGLDVSQVETIIDEPLMGKLLLAICDANGDAVAKIAGNWIGGTLQKAVADGHETWQQVFDARDGLVELAKMVEAGDLSSSAAKDILLEVITTNGDPRAIAGQKNLLQVSDTNELAAIVQRVLEENPKAADDVKRGEMKAIGFLVGQVMKASQGKANPGVVQSIIKTQLGV